MPANGRRSGATPAYPGSGRSCAGHSRTKPDHIPARAIWRTFPHSRRSLWIGGIVSHPPHRRFPAGPPPRPQEIPHKYIPVVPGVSAFSELLYFCGAPPPPATPAGSAATSNSHRRRSSLLSALSSFLVPESPTCTTCRFTPTHMQARHLVKTPATSTTCGNAPKCTRFRTTQTTPVAVTQTLPATEAPTPSPFLLSISCFSFLHSQLTAIRLPPAPRERPPLPRR